MLGRISPLHFAGSDLKFAYHEIPVQNVTVTPMPIYEYRCLACGVSFEKILSSSTSTESIACSHCRSLKVQKKISVTSYRVSSTGVSSIPSGALSGCSSKSGFS